MRAIAISDAKANRLYWLGRYAERAYLSLHLLRRYFDLTLDGNPVDYKSYAKNLGPTVEGPLSFEEFAKTYIFSKDNPSSIIPSLTGANDNAILLREVIKSESLSYIQMSICLLERLESKISEVTVNDLQKVTDYLLAFYGSLEERLFNDKEIAFVRYGRLIESLDMHMRFNYEFVVIRDVFDSLIRWMDIEKSVFNKVELQNFDAMLVEKKYELNDESYKVQLLGMVNKIVNL